MHGAAQQVQQRFLIVFAGRLQGVQAAREALQKRFFLKAAGKHGVIGQLVNNAGVAGQVAGRPACRAQQAQQALVYGGALQQHGQVAFAPQQGLQPVHQAQHACFGDAGIGRRAHQPLQRLLHQAQQALACVGAQRGDARVLAPGRQALGERRVLVAQQRQQGCQVIAGQRWRGLGLCGVVGRATVFAGFFTAEQHVELACHHVAVQQQIVQKAAGIGVAQGLRNPQQIGIVGGQDMGLLVVQVLDAVLHAAQKDVGLGQRVGTGVRDEFAPRQLRQGVQRGAHAQFGVLAAAHDLQQLHDKFNFADAAA